MGIDTRKFDVLEEELLEARIRGEGLVPDLKPTLRTKRGKTGENTQWAQLLVLLPFLFQGRTDTGEPRVVQGNCRVAQMIFDPHQIDFNPDTNLPNDTIVTLVKQAREEHGLKGKALLNRKILVRRYRVKRKRTGDTLEIYDFEGLV